MHKRAASSKRFPPASLRLRILHKRASWKDLFVDCLAQKEKPESVGVNGPGSGG